MRLTVFGYDFDVDHLLVAEDAEALRTQVAAYERGERTAFSLAISFPDDFTGDVMRAMSKIPYGETRTYGELAAELETSAVAVGGACGRNPTPIVVPCHRVVGAESLGGFSADAGVEAKRALLAHERGEPVQRTLP